MKPATLSWRVLGILGYVIVGCAPHGGLSGAYREVGSLREIVLNPDGTYRMLYGERTSPADAGGRYELLGDHITFGGTKMEGLIKDGRLLVDGRVFTKK